MRIDRPLNQFREIVRKSNNDDMELLKYVFEKSDNISLWIIGLSIGGISIFANNITDIQNEISPYYLKPILLLLTISVTSGIIYRGFYLYFFVVLNHTFKAIEIVFSNRRMMDTESILTGNETIKELVVKVLNGTGDDLSYLITAFNNVDENAKEIIYKSIVDHYLKSVEFAQRDTALSLEFIADTYSKFFGMNKEKLLKKLENPSVGRGRYKIFLTLTMVFYFLYILTFIAALFAFVFAT